MLGWYLHVLDFATWLALSMVLLSAVIDSCDLLTRLMVITLHLATFRITGIFIQYNYILWMNQIDYLALCARVSSNFVNKLLKANVQLEYSEGQQPVLSTTFSKRHALELKGVASVNCVDFSLALSEKIHLDLSAAAMETTRMSLWYAIWHHSLVISWKTPIEATWDELIYGREM